ncbi:MAG: ABC transporter substrate-binding protein [Thermodesulfobacteriota bacterium]|nr:ABC transporter substrate-binding protein [Thermodesulfobacteriota bacterium]
MKLVTVIWIFIFVLFSLALSSTFFTKVQAAQGKPEAVYVAMLADLSGPYAPGTAGLNSGMKDACEYVNTVLGGIKGVPVKSILRDTGGNVSVAISRYMEVREMKPRPIVLIISVSSESEALKERFAEDKFPCISVVSVPAIYPPAYTFGMAPLWADQFGAFIDWLVETKEGLKDPKHPKVAILTWDTAFGRSVLTDDCFDYAKKKGVEIVAKELFGVMDIDVSTQLFRIRSKKADWIYTCTSFLGPPVIMKSARGFRYKINLCNAPMDWSLINIGGDVMEGVTGMLPFESWDDSEHPGIKLVDEWFKKKGRKPSERVLGYLLAWGNIITIVECTRRAVDEGGWDNLDGPAVKAQFEKLRDFKALDLAYFDYTPKRRTPTKVKMYRIKGGKILPITDWRVCPDLRPAKYK